MLETRSLLVAGQFVPCPGIFVRAARPPTGVPTDWPSARAEERLAGFVRRLPKTSTIKPSERHVRLGALQLMEGREQVLASR